MSADLLRSLRVGVRLLLLRPLAPAERLRPGWHYWPLFALQVLLSIAIESYWAYADQPLSANGLQSDAFVALLLLASATLAAMLLRRPVLGWSLAVIWIAAGLWLTLLWALLEAALWQLGWYSQRVHQYSMAVLLGWWLLALWHSLGQLAPERTAAHRFAGALLAATLSALPVFALDPETYYGPVPPTATIEPPWPLAQSPEALLMAQHGLLQRQLDDLATQDPERVDAYLLAFGGDGSEDVFRNEIDYVEALFERRFGMQGRTMALLNHPSTVSTRPLATLSNLRAALQGLGERMDLEQDLLLLFLTSHGSEDHELFVNLLGLPLDQVTPVDLKRALADSGIRWKVLIVSACYSGGFIEHLADSSTLVITAARADRSSFGCGPDSDFTYFGRALFINALNQTTDLLAAFELAKAEVTRREGDEERLASEPQIASNPLIEAVLDLWQSQLDAGPPLPWPLSEAAPADELQ